MPAATQPDTFPRQVLEIAGEGLPTLRHPEWAVRFPWLAQGTTRRGDGDVPFDLGLFSDASTPRDVLGRWARLRAGLGFDRVAHAHQVHGSTVRPHGPGPPGVHLADDCDGHATADTSVLLTVTVADCVPVSLVDERRRAVALVHAGWRGAAAGILEVGLRVLHESFGVRTENVHVHLGPSICGSCYEVGPEVFAALGLHVPDRARPLDLRSVLAIRAVEAGVSAARVTASSHCTLCGDAGLFSHRGGDNQRQVAYLGIRS